MQRSTIQKIVARSVAEVELFAVTSNPQDMMYAKSLGIDKKGAVDIVNNHSVGGRKRHMETRQN